MSSATFETDLVPSKSLRRVVLSAACTALLLGTILILWLPVDLWLKALFGSVWLVSSTGELQRFRRAMSRIDRICMTSDGTVTGVGRNGARHALSLLDGSIVLERAAWLRFRFADGVCYGELLAGDALTSDQWHRLRLLWRQRG